MQPDWRPDQFKLFARQITLRKQGNKGDIPGRGIPKPVSTEAGKQQLAYLLSTNQIRNLVLQMQKSTPENRYNQEFIQTAKRRGYFEELDRATRYKLGLPSQNHRENRNNGFERPL